MYKRQVVARVESQILELVALIYEDVVDAHLLEIQMCIRDSNKYGTVNLAYMREITDSRQGFFGRAYVGMALHREGNRMREDVRLEMCIRDSLCAPVWCVWQRAC